MNKKVKELIETSKQVIRDCSLPNGALVASNSSKKYFPREAKNYRFVWPRDAMYTCIAANILGIEVHKKYFDWLLKAEGFSKTGLFYENYYVNGKKLRKHFQPDQTGSVLITLHDYYKDKKIPKKHEKLLIKAANGICGVWSKDHFNVLTQDLWEERYCFADLKENFSYSTAICSKGLMLANELMPNKKWEKVSGEMRLALLKNKGAFTRSFGGYVDSREDASLLGLVWPAEMVKPSDKRIKKTVELIKEKIVENNGVYRYLGDEYDGWMYIGGDKKEIEAMQKGLHRKKGAGYWPLLTFWMSIYYLEAGNKTKALNYYNKVLKDIKNSKFIPEQVFNNKTQISVSPLCWSHSMFVIASKKLGRL
ncbi:hypothetical protein GOV05_00250 [Candidatus Woesearchaeota archaeon]|nr:hypothetical protein [Candidatus Woesearchaeota archaeon]